MTDMGPTLAHLSSWASAARVQAIGSILDLPVDRLLETIEGCEDLDGRGWLVATTLDLDSVAVLTRDRGRAGLFVEVETAGKTERLATELHASRRGVLAADLALLGRLAPIAGEVQERLATLAALIAPGGRAAGVSARTDAAGGRRFALHLPVERGPATRGLVEAADAVGITAAQRGLLVRLHPILASSHAAIASLRIASGVLPRLTMTYRDVAFESALRIAAGLRPGITHAARLGQVAGACDAPRLAALSLELRDHEAPELRVSFGLVRS